MAMKRFSGVLVCVLALAGVVMCLGCSPSGAASSASASAASTSAVSASASAAAASTVASSSAASTSASASTSSASLAPGVYTVDVKTDSSMFRVNESKNGKGELTVRDGAMTVHISLAAKGIVNLYAGTKDQAQANPDDVIQPTTDKVTYSDGVEEEVYGFDIPVPVLDEEFDVAILGEKGTWYDHKVSVSDPIAE